MATYAAVLAAVASKVEADIGATRLASDLRDDTTKVAPGALAYQLRGLPVGRSFRSNSTYRVMEVQVEILRALSVGEAETAWTEGALLTHFDLLTDPSWWEAVAGVLEIGERGDLESGFNAAITREGRIVNATVTATLVLQP